MSTSTRLSPHQLYLRRNQRTVEQRIRYKASVMKAHAAERGISWQLTPDDIVSMWHEQDGRLSWMMAFASVGLGLRAACTLSEASAIFSTRGNVDPNAHDLRFLLHGTQWLIAELLRNVSGLTMQESGQLVNLVHAPIGGLIDDTGFRRLVQHPGEASDEILILLHSRYGTVTTIDTIFQSLNRRTQKQVRNALASLWRRMLIDGSPKEGYVLTGMGFDTAVKLQTQPQAEPKKSRR